MLVHPKRQQNSTHFRTRALTHHTRRALFPQPTRRLTHLETANRPHISGNVCVSTTMRKSTSGILYSDQTPNQRLLNPGTLVPSNYPRNQLRQTYSGMLIPEAFGNTIHTGDARPDIWEPTPDVSRNLALI